MLNAGGTFGNHNIKMIEIWVEHFVHLNQWLAAILARSHVEEIISTRLPGLMKEKEQRKKCHTVLYSSLTASHVGAPILSLGNSLITFTLSCFQCALCWICHLHEHLTFFLITLVTIRCQKILNKVCQLSKHPQIVVLTGWDVNHLKGGQQLGSNH